jgi:hypothetical protein
VNHVNLPKGIIMLSLGLLAALGCSGESRDAPQFPPSCPAAGECGSNCMHEHMLEGRSLNEERMPLYAALTDDASLEISRMLIGYETFALPFADIIDSIASPWQEAGICIGCEEFVSMDLTPPFRDGFQDGPPALGNFHSQDGAELTRNLRQTFQRESFTGLSASLEEKLDRLQAAPKFHCMLRHILESLLRISNLAPLHQNDAEALGLESTGDLSTVLVDLHLLVIAQAVSADELAAPLQAADVPIICRDVPHISPYPEDIACRIREAE